MAFGLSCWGREEIKRNWLFLKQNFESESKWYFIAQPLTCLPEQRSWGFSWLSGWHRSGRGTPVLQAQLSFSWAEVLGELIDLPMSWLSPMYKKRPGPNLMSKPGAPWAKIGLCACFTLELASKYVKLSFFRWKLCSPIGQRCSIAQIIFHSFTHFCPAQEFWL